MPSVTSGITILITTSTSKTKTSTVPANRHRLPFDLDEISPMKRRGESALSEIRTSIYGSHRALGLAAAPRTYQRTSFLLYVGSIYLYLWSGVYLHFFCLVLHCFLRVYRHRKSTWCLPVSSMILERQWFLQIFIFSFVFIQHITNLGGKNKSKKEKKANVRAVLALFRMNAIYNVFREPLCTEPHVSASWFLYPHFLLRFHLAEFRAITFARLQVPLQKKKKDRRSVNNRLHLQESPFHSESLCARVCICVYVCAMSTAHKILPWISKTLCCLFCRCLSHLIHPLVSGKYVYSHLIIQTFSRNISVRVATL